MLISPQVGLVSFIMSFVDGSLEMDMYRRFIYLPLILLMASLACSQIPGQLPVSTSTLEPVSVEISTSSPPGVLPTPTGAAAQTATSVPQAADLTPTAQSPDNLAADNDLIDPGKTTEPIYNLQSGSPAPMNNIFYSELGCNWMGVGGQVFGESGQPVGMLIVELGGSLNGEKIEELTLTGSASQWGPGGYEFQISDMPIASVGELWLRVLNLDSVPLSEKVYFDTFENCEQTAIMVNFIHYSASTYEQLFFPVIIQDQ